MPTALTRSLGYCYRRGIAGFRIDVAHAMVKDRELRDNPPATEHKRISSLGRRRSRGEAGSGGKRSFTPRSASSD